MNERPPAGVDPPVKEPAAPIAAAAEWTGEPTAEPAADPFADFDPLPPRHAGPSGAVARYSSVPDSPAEFDPESVDDRVFADETERNPRYAGDGVTGALAWTAGYIGLVNLPLLALFFFFRPRSPGETAVGVAGAIAAGYALGLKLTLRALKRSWGEEWRGNVGMRPPGRAFVGLAVLLFPCAAIAAVWLAQLSTPLEARPAADTARRAVVGGHPVLFVVVMGVVAGVCEELWFRGVLGAALVRHCGRVVGVGVTSVLFGLAHLNPHAVLAIILMGVVLHVVYLTSGSLWIPIGMHVVNNAIAVLTIGHVDKIPLLLGVASLYWTVFFLAAFVLVRDKYGPADDPAARQPGVRRRSSPVSPEGGVRVSLSPRAVRLIVKLVLGIAVLLVLFVRM